MAANNLKQKNLAPLLASESIVSEVLSRKRELDKRHIEKVSKRLKLSPALFFKNSQTTALGSSRTENPADAAALASRLSPHIKLLFDGRCSHQTNDAASWRLSAARKEYLSSDCVANSRT